MTNERHLEEEMAGIRRDIEEHEAVLREIGDELLDVASGLINSPASTVGRGATYNPAITGPTPKTIEMDKLRGLFDEQASGNIAQILDAYQELLRKCHELEDRMLACGSCQLQFLSQRHPSRPPGSDEDPK